MIVLSNRFPCFVTNLKCIKMFQYVLITTKNCRTGKYRENPICDQKEEKFPCVAVSISIFTNLVFNFLFLLFRDLPILPFCNISHLLNMISWIYTLTLKEKKLVQIKQHIVLPLTLLNYTPRAEFKKVVW